MKTKMTKAMYGKSMMKTGGMTNPNAKASVTKKASTTGVKTKVNNSSIPKAKKGGSTLSASMTGYKKKMQGGGSIDPLGPNPGSCKGGKCTPPMGGKGTRTRGSFGKRKFKKLTRG